MTDHGYSDDWPPYGEEPALPKAPRVLLGACDYVIPYCPECRGMEHLACICHDVPGSMDPGCSTIGIDSRAE